MEPKQRVPLAYDRRIRCKGLEYWLLRFFE